MRIEDRLDKGTRTKLNTLRGTKKKEKHKKHKEQFSEKDIEDLMGVHRPRYYKNKGSYRQR